LKIVESIIKYPDIEIDPGRTACSRLLATFASQLEHLIWQLLFAQLDGHIDIMKAISLQKRSKDIRQVDLLESV
jgi:hypothetical protein